MPQGRDSKLFQNKVPESSYQFSILHWAFTMLSILGNGFTTAALVLSGADHSSSASFLSNKTAHSMCGFDSFRLGSRHSHTNNKHLVCEASGVYCVTEEFIGLLIK
jgi:hypothetical protein